MSDWSTLSDTTHCTVLNSCHPDGTGGVWGLVDGPEVIGAHTRSIVIEEVTRDGSFVINGIEDKTRIIESVYDEFHRIISNIEIKIKSMR